MKMRILVLEDSFGVQEMIAELVKSLINKKYHTHIAVEFIGSITAFKNLFQLKKYTGVILDDKVLDGNAFRLGLPEWVREKDSKVGIGLNSSDCCEELAKRV